MLLYLCDESAPIYPVHKWWRASDIAHIKCKFHTATDIVAIRTGDKVRNTQLWRKKAKYCTREMMCTYCVSQSFQFKRMRFNRPRPDRGRATGAEIIFYELLKSVRPEYTVTPIPRPDK